MSIFVSEIYLTVVVLSLALLISHTFLQSITSDVFYFDPSLLLASLEPFHKFLLTIFSCYLKLKLILNEIHETSFFVECLIYRRSVVEAVVKRRSLYIGCCTTKLILKQVVYSRTN